VLLPRVGQISLRVHDLDRAAAFYRDVLELPLLFAASNLAFFDCGGLRLMLGRPEKPELDHPSSILYFEVGDVPAVHRTLVARGVRFVNEPHVVARLPQHDVWMAFFHDTEDNLLALMRHAPRAE
jgi:methylmalonyl-CoA/ethylmalonyl-CoA epimerase